MSIVSGIATASGVSSLLNASRDTNTVLRFAAGDPVPQAAVRRPEEDRRAVSNPQAVRPVVAPNAAEGAQTPIRRESSDPRYTKFVDAVEALRVDLSETSLTRERIAELREAAKIVFRMDGVPEDKRDEIRDQAAEQADRAEVRAADNRKRDAQAEVAREGKLEAAAARREASGKAAEVPGTGLASSTLPEAPRPPLTEAGPGGEVPRATMPEVPGVPKVKAPVPSAGTAETPRPGATAAKEGPSPAPAPTPARQPELADA